MRFYCSLKMIEALAQVAQNFEIPHFRVTNMDVLEFKSQIHSLFIKKLTLEILNFIVETMMAIKSWNH